MSDEILTPEVMPDEEPVDAVPVPVEDKKSNTPFRPTASMERFLDAALGLEVGPQIKDWMVASKLNQATITKWFKDAEFCSWFSREFQKRLDLHKVELIKIGLRKMAQDPKTWEKMVNLFFPNGLEFGTGPKGTRESLEQTLLSVFKIKSKK